MHCSHVNLIRLACTRIEKRATYLLAIGWRFLISLCPVCWMPRTSRRRSGRSCGTCRMISVWWKKSEKRFRLISVTLFKSDFSTQGLVQTLDFENFWSAIRMKAFHLNSATHANCSPFKCMAVRSWFKASNFWNLWIRWKPDVYILCSSHVFLMY